MSKVLLGILIIFCQLSIEGYGCNTRILDSEAEEWVSKTWSKIPFTENQIKGSLIFLDPSKDPSSTYKQYLEAHKFDELYKGIQDPRLLSFANLCREIYTGDIPINSISVFMLLQSVTEKYSSILQKAESLKPFKEKKDENKNLLDTSLLDMFLNADKSIKAQ